jgi:hypothetical protein
LPVASEESRAMDETRPDTRPKLGVRTAPGPIGSHEAGDADACGFPPAAPADARKRAAGRCPGKIPRRARKRRAASTRGGTAAFCEGPPTFCASAAAHMVSSSSHARARRNPLAEFKILLRRVHPHIVEGRFENRGPIVAYIRKPRSGLPFPHHGGRARRRPENERLLTFADSQSGNWPILGQRKKSSL